MIRTSLAMCAVLAAAVVVLQTPAGAQADLSTFTFTVPVQLTAISGGLRPQVSCGVSSGTETNVSASMGAGAGKGAGRSFTSAKKSDGTPGEVIAENIANVPMTGPSFAGNVSVVVNARTPALAATAHSYACAILFDGSLVQQRFSARTGYVYDNTTLRVIAKGTLQ